MRFVMDELAGFADLSAPVPAFADATPDMADAILDEAAKFTEQVLAPLNVVGDKEGCTLAEHGVTTPTGWKAAYQAFARPAGTASPARRISRVTASPRPWAWRSGKWWLRPTSRFRSARC